MPIEEDYGVELFHASSAKEIARLGSQIADFAGEGWITQDTYRRLGLAARERLKELRGSRENKEEEAGPPAR